jgi:DNA-directed RNA polymerase subunit RPC12/RpoP
MSSLPPQRSGGGSGPPSRGPKSNLTAREGVEEAERRLGRPCYLAGQKVPGRYRCVTCQFQIMNRGVLPMCPDCGERVWVWMDEGPRPVPEGATAAPATPSQAAGPRVEEGVKLDAPGAPVKVEEGVKLEP